MKRLAIAAVGLAVTLVCGCGRSETAPKIEATYPPSVVADFMTGCTKSDSSRAYCECFVQGLQENFTLEEYKHLAAQIYNAGGILPDKMASVADKCWYLKPTPEPTATAEPSPVARSVTSADVPHYLDVSSMLPGFQRVDPAEAGIDLSQIGPEAVAAYLSEQPYQSLLMYSEVLTTASDKAVTKAEMRGTTYPETFMTLVVDPVAKALGGHLIKTDIQWSEPPVGDIAHLANVRAEVTGGTADVRFLIFAQEQGTGMALVVIYSFSLVEEPAAIDVVTVGKEISAKIANP